MFSVFVSALNVALGFLIRSVIVKFAVFFGLFFVTTGFVSLLAPLLPNGSALSSALGGLPSGVWYFLDLFNVSAGIPILLSAWASRFIIRRIPIIG